MITLLLALAAQTALTKLPPAKALPPPSADEQAVLAPINGLFAAIRAKDGAQILGLAQADGRLTAIAPGKPPRVLTWADYAAGYKAGEGPAFDERLVGEPAIEIDRDVAMVWAPYEFLVDGKVVACGTDHFDLIRDGGRWKLLNVTWSQRKPGDCAAQ